MKFFAVIACLSSLTSVASEVSISIDSDAGRNLMSKARQLEGNNNNNYYYSWIKDYSVKFAGCTAVPQFEKEEGVRSNLLAKFKLCPTGKCGMCPNAGEYVVDMREFVEAWQEAKQTENQAKCESAEYDCEYKCQNGLYTYDGGQQYNYDNGNNNNNNNGDNNDEYCSYQCLVDQGLGYCAQDDQQDNEVNMNELAECRPMNENDNKNNNNNGNYYNSNTEVYYVGAYCTSKGVFAGTFTDSACTKKAPKGTYEKLNYGYSLPTEPLVEYGCISCLDSSNNNNNNNNNGNGYAISEFCDKVYDGAAKCEKNVKGTSYRDTSACDLIHNIIPKLNSAFSSINGGANVAKIFAWIFGVALVFMAWYIYRLHKIIGRDTSIQVGSFNLMGNGQPA